jgi:hypothetical protein
MLYSSVFYLFSPRKWSFNLAKFIICSDFTFIVEGITDNELFLFKFNVFYWIFSSFSRFNTLSFKVLKPFIEQVLWRYPIGCCFYWFNSCKYLSMALMLFRSICLVELYFSFFLKSSSPKFLYFYLTLDVKSFVELSKFLSKICLRYLGKVYSSKGRLVFLLFKDKFGWVCIYWTRFRLNF